jgi:hypothetical protein
VVEEYYRPEQTAKRPSRLPTTLPATTLATTTLASNP